MAAWSELLSFCYEYETQVLVAMKFVSNKETHWGRPVVYHDFWNVNKTNYDQLPSPCYIGTNITFEVYH